MLEQCPYYNVERLFVDMERSRKMLEPTMTALASLEPEQVEAAATNLPTLVGHLTSEFAATREAVRVAAERFEKMLRVQALIEMLTTASAMNMAEPPRHHILPREFREWFETRGQPFQGRHGARLVGCFHPRNP